MIWTVRSRSNIGARRACAALAAACALGLLSGCLALKAGEALPREAEDRRSGKEADPDRDDEPERTQGDADAARDGGDAGNEDASRDEEQPVAQNDDPREQPEADAEADMDTEEAAPARAVCPDLTTQSCAASIWPDATIPYAFAETATARAQIRDAMDRWERAAAHAIRFVEAPEVAAKVTLHGCGEPSVRASGFDGCEDGCDVALCAGSVHYELGRLIGLTPVQRRYDRDHYLRVVDSCDEASRVARCTSPNNVSDLGPFDFASSLMPPEAADWITRWDGSPLCESTPMCRGDGERAPTAYDGSAVIERYGLERGWGKFLRTVDLSHPDPYEPELLEPLQDQDNSGLPLPLPADASPALETWGWDSLAIYVRAENGAIYKKWLMTDVLRWSDWESLDQPSGLGALSDPAIAGWAADNSHLLVRRGGSVHILSNKKWDVWESLGGPESPAAASPAITSWGENRLDIVVRAEDDRLYHKVCSAECVGASGTWSEWLPLDGATLRGKPAIVARAPGKLAVFSQGTDGQLWTIAYDAGAWGVWAPLPVQVPLSWDETCPDCTSPAAGARSTDSIDVYVRGRDQLLWTSTWTEQGGFSEFIPLGGVLASSPATISTVTADGRADVIAILEEKRGDAASHRAVWWKRLRVSSP